MSLGRGLFDDRLDIVTAGIDIVAHCLSRTFPIAIGNAVKYRQMLLARALDALRDLEVEHSEDREPVVDRAQLMEQDLVVDGAGKRFVKLPIEPGHFIDVISPN